MTEGEKRYGFSVRRVREISELDGTLYELEHEKSGAQLAWLSRKEENKTFLIGFETLPENDTGVFHILEHSVLCGSQKYPVREPFVELLKTSMNTFLNAMTYPDKTVYPVSSRNEADFFNLASVYLDAVFNPAIEENPNIFRQEGWHYELTDPQGKPSYKGVVFNEMKGAFSSVDEVVIMGMNRLLYPQNGYRFVSGGDPAEIPRLTGEEFLRCYRRFYHPSNAKIFLDGDLPIDKMLCLLDEEYLSRFTRKDPDFFLAEQPLVPAGESTQEYPISPKEDPKGKAYFTMGRIAGNWREKEKLLALEVLSDVLTGSQDAPLKRAILEKGLGQNVSLEMDGEIAQPWIKFQVENTDPQHFEEIERTYYETLEQLAENGLDPEELAASINQLEFQLLERKEPQGLILGLSSLRSWLYGGDPVLYLTYKDAFTFLRSHMNDGYFTRLMQEIFLDREHMVTLKTLPSQTREAEMQQEEEKRLEEAASAWSQEDRERLTKETAELLSWQQTPDSPQALGSLPTLGLDDVSKEPIPLQAQVETHNGLTLLKSPSAAPGIAYLNLFFSLEDVLPEDFPALTLFSSLLGNLPTEKRSAAELNREVKAHLGRLTFSPTSYAQTGDTETCRSYFVVSCSVLEENEEKALELIREILLETRPEEDRIREILLQLNAAYRQALIESGNSFASLRTLSHYSALGAVREATSGYTCYRWLHDFSQDYDGNKDGFLEQFRKFRDSIFCSSRLTLGISGSISSRLVDKLIDSLPQGTAAKPVSIPVTPPCREGILIPSGVSYAALGNNLAAINAHSSGTLAVASSILSFQYLWGAIRVQGGAYGTGFLAGGNRDDAVFYSYRDPNPMNSLAVYAKSADFLREFCRGDEDLESKIVGAIASTEPLLSPYAKAMAICSYYFRKIGLEDQRRLRREMLETTKASLEELCPMLEKLSAQGSQCVAGPETAFADKDAWTLLSL